MATVQEKFLEIIVSSDKNKGVNSRLLNKEDYNNIINRLGEIVPGQKKTYQDFSWLNRYDVIQFENVKFLSKKGRNTRIVAAEEIYEIIRAAHLTTGHGVIFGKNGQDYIMVMKSTGKSAIYLHPNGDCLVLDYDQPKDFSNEQIVLNPNVEPRVFDKLIVLCVRVHTKQYPVKKLVDVMAAEGKILYPGTKWCGQGNSSDHDDDFGSAIETDKCCKEHDYCERFLDPGQCDQSMNLCNEGKYTSSHCDCDEIFRHCLERAYEVENTANMVGYTFFSFLGMECFRKDHPIIKCLEWGGWAWSFCQDYLLDVRAPKLYQFFNSKKWW